jgi:acid phosphatase
MQTSSEYRATCLQIYRAAIHQMGVALVDRNATAAIEQRAAMLDPNHCAANLPPAVILDVDETVLDNSGFQAQMIASGQQYSPEAWAEWTSDAPSIPVPGVKEFLDACQAAGVTPFFVTNRATEVKAATRANLLKYDLISPESPVDTLLCKQDRDTWTSDKYSRRAHIARSYRILLLIGDDLNDFVSVGIKPTPSARRSLANEHASNWGTKWFMLPNPNYGGWERAIHGWRDQSARETKLKLKRDLLRLEPPGNL